jgi:hypothetical protein
MPARIELIIDEIHNIYDRGRGYNISESITKALYGGDTRIVMMTATLESDALSFLREWTNSHHYTRNAGASHVPILMVCKTMHCSILRDGSFERTDIPSEITNGDPARAAADILMTTENAQIVIFTNTRERTGQIAERICKSTGDEEIASPHNAMMESEEKKIIVRMFNTGSIRCIICALTLSTGVNLRNVTHVFVVGSTKWNGSVFAPYQRAELYQMCGRVARGLGSKGTAYLFEGGNDCECQAFARAFATPSTSGIPVHISNEFAVRMYVKNYPYETAGDPQSYLGDIFKALPPCLSEIDFSRLNRMGEFTAEAVPSVRLAAIAKSGFQLSDGLELAEQLIENSREMDVADKFHLLTLCTPDSGDDMKRLCDAGVLEWKVFVEYMANMKNASLREYVPVIRHAKTYEGMMKKPETKLVTGVRRQLAAFLVMRWIPGIWIAETAVLSPILDEMMLRAERILRLCLELHLAMLAVLIEHVAVRLRNGTSGYKNALACLPSCSRALARVLYRQNLKYIEQVAGMQVSELAEMIAIDTRRRNHIYNAAIAAKMIKEARRLSFAGSAIVPLTK